MYKYARTAEEIPENSFPFDVSLMPSGRLQLVTRLPVGCRPPMADPVPDDFASRNPYA